MSSVKFREPPLKEIIFGVNFEISNFSSIHFGLFWQTIKDRFPESLDIPEEPTLTDESLVLFNLPTVWYRASTKDRFIQLRNGYFAYHYRYQQKDYPHFEKLFSEFLKEWENLLSWWLETSKEQIVNEGYQLNYLNIIDEDYGWQSIQDNSKIFKFTNLGIASALNSLKSYSCKLEFELPENLGILKVSLDEEILENDEDEEKNVMLFSLAAQKYDEQIEDPKHWFNYAHEYIIKYFLDLTQEEIQNSWGRYGI
jgi:uncharacterized protein (TIGR04255 family)